MIQKALSMCGWPEVPVPSLEGGWTYGDHTHFTHAVPCFHSSVYRLVSVTMSPSLCADLCTNVGLKPRCHLDITTR